MGILERAEFREVQHPTPSVLTYHVDEQLITNNAGEGMLLQPKPQRVDTQLAAFHIGHAPQAGASFSPSLGRLQVSTKGSRLQRSNKNVLQRVEERHRRVLSEKANLAAFATHLRMQKKFKEADKYAMRSQLLLEREKTIDVFQDDLIEVDTGIPVAPFKSIKLGTPDRPLADPLGLALVKHDMEMFGLSTSSSSEDSVLTMLDYTDSSAFKMMLASEGEGPLTAGQRLRKFVQLKYSSDLYKRLNIASSREEDIRLEKETLLAKQLYQKVAEGVQRARAEHEFVADMFKGMVLACLHTVCQRVLPQEPLCDVLQRYHALGLPSRGLRNKEFLPLTQKDLDLCADAWSGGKPEDEVMVNALGMKLLRKDLRTLAGLSWLNDEVINFYLELMRVRSNLPGFPKCHFFNTFFYARLSNEGKGYNYGNVRRWTRKVDIFSFDKVIVPIHLSVHWTAAVINFRDRKLEFYDSMGNPGRHHLELLQKYVGDEHRDKKHLPFDVSSWTIHTPGSDIPQQRNSSDCGVFCCKFMNCLAQDVPFAFGQHHMPYFRQRLVVELLSAKVL